MKAALLALALGLTAGRASADLHCVSNLSEAGPHGELCGGTPHTPTQAQQPQVNPAAAAQLTNLAGGVAGSILGNALVAPLPNQYQGHQPVKPVVSDDDGIKTPGVGAASDIIGGYKPDGDSYGAKLAHFRELHDAEMDQRREALKLLKGTSAEKWCAAHIGILFPTPPVSDVINRYPNQVRAYDREKQIWDQRCGGPSQQPGYQSFTDELAGLKQDGTPSAVAGSTTKGPTYEAPAPPPSAAPAETPKAPADSFADAANELQASPTKKKEAGTDAPSSAQQTTPSAAGAAPDAAASPDDSANTNHSTNFFGQPNAKVTAKDLADTRAPDLTDHGPSASGTAGANGGGMQWSGIPQAKGMPSAPAPDIPRSWGTPEEVAVFAAPKRPAQFPNPMDYLLRSIPFLKEKAADKAEEEVKSGTKKALLAEFGGFEGRILYNMYELPEYVLKNVLRAAKGDMTLKQADWLTAGAANVLYNFDSVPNGVMAKIAEKGDAAAGIAAYGSDKAAAAVNDAVIRNTSDAVAKGYDFARFGDVSEKAPDGMETNMYVNRMANTRVLTHEGKTALKGVAPIYSLLQGGQADPEKPSGDQ